MQVNVLWTQTVVLGNYNGLFLKQMWWLKFSSILFVWPYAFTRGILTVLACSLIVPETYPVDNILSALLVVQGFFWRTSLFYHTESHCCRYCVISAWQFGSMSQSVPRGIGWWHILSSCIFCQLTKGALSETSGKSTYIRVMMLIVGAR